MATKLNQGAYDGSGCEAGSLRARGNRGHECGRPRAPARARRESYIQGVTRFGMGDDMLPAHPILTAPAAAAATGRAKSAIHQAVVQLEEAGVLLPLSSGRRNRSWEAAGLLDLIAGLEAGEPPTR